MNKLLISLLTLGTLTAFAGEKNQVQESRVVINGGDITQINIYPERMTIFTKIASCSIEKDVADSLGGVVQLTKAIKGDSTLSLHCIGSIAPRLGNREPMAKADSLMMFYQK